MESCSYQPCRKANGCLENEMDTTYNFISPLCRAFRPMFVSFCVAGIFPNYGDRITSGMWCLTIAYSACVIVTLILTTGRWIVSAVYEHNVTFGVDLFLRILLINWGLENTARYTGCAVSFAWSVRLKEFFKEWKTLRTQNSQALSCIHKHSWLCAAVAFGITAINAGMIIYAHVWSPRAAQLISPFPESSQYAHVIIPLTAISGAYMTFAWVAPSLLMNLVGHSLTLEFMSNCDDLEDLENSDPITFANTIKGVRIRHQKISKLVCGADRVFSMHIAFSLMGSVVAVCLLLYNLIWDPDQDMMHIFMGTFWVVGALAKIILDCVTGATLNNAVSNLAVIL